MGSERGIRDCATSRKLSVVVSNRMPQLAYGGGHGTLRDEPVEDGVRNAHCGGDQFDLDWQGQRQNAVWHIKSGGNTRDPHRKTYASRKML